MSEVKQVEINDVIDIVKQNNKNANVDKILKAYEFAKKMHSSQFRKSGEPYIIHPVQVAYILATLELDTSTICRG